MEQMTLEEMQARIPGEITEEMARWTLDKFDHYAFLRREKKFVGVPGMGGGTKNVQVAHCTACHKEFQPVLDLAQGDKTKCPHCGAKLTAKHAGRGRKYLIEEFRVLWYLPSLAGKDEITAVMLHLARDYRGDYKTVQTFFAPCCMYVFRYGVGAWMYKRAVRLNTWTANRYGEASVSRWEPQKTISIGQPEVRTFMTGFVAPWWENDESLDTAVKGTPFAYMRENKVWRDGAGLLRYVALAAKYPSVEYLVKLGFAGVVQDKVNGNPTFGAVHWRANSLQKVTGLTKADLKEIRQNGMDVDCQLLDAVRRARKTRPGMTLGEAIWLRDIGRRTMGCKGVLEAITANGSQKTWTSYIAAQAAKNETRAIAWNSAMNDLVDYIRECIELGMDLSDTAICRPKDLHKAHQRTSAQLRAIREEQRRQKDEERAKQYENDIRKRVKKLTAFRFEFAGLLLRPFESAKEVVAEGVALSHCVGSYVGAYSSGKTVLCALRKVDAPDKPWHTVELNEKTGEVIQCRGYKNKSTDAEKRRTDAFFAAFAKHFAASGEKQKTGRKTA